MTDRVAELLAEREVLLTALRFYADPDRYMGPNQRVKPGDVYTPDGSGYRLDVTRDDGQIARAALASATPKAVRA